jgi:cytoskeletal protein RodZ
MAPRSTHDRVIGIGPALRKAREHRGLSLEEAARDTRLRAGQLAALEDEDFDALSGDVYVRASLRTYATYLGLDADKVSAAYARHAEDPAPPSPPGKLGRVERMIAATRIRDNQRLLLITAAGLVVVLIVFGWLSRDHGAPLPAAIPTVTASAVPSDQSFAVVLVAARHTSVTVTVDGERETRTMVEEEQLSFEASQELTVALVDGGAVTLTVAGHDLGVPGVSGLPWTRTYTFQEVSAWPSPSPSPSPTGSVSGSPGAPGSSGPPGSTSATASPSV